MHTGLPALLSMSPSMRPRSTRPSSREEILEMHAAIQRQLLHGHFEMSKPKMVRYACIELRPEFGLCLLCEESIVTSTFLLT